MSPFSLGFIAGIGFSVGIAALFGLVLFYAAESDWTRAESVGRVLDWRNRR